MTRAQGRLAVFVEWVKTSSTTVKAPNGKDIIVRGPYAVFVPQSLSLPPTPSEFTEGHLPLWLPEAIPNLPPFTQDPPENQEDAQSRLKHIIWMFMDGRFEGVALLGLTDPQETLQSALNRQLRISAVRERADRRIVNSRIGAS